MNRLWIIAIVILGAGIWGGLMNFFISDPEAEPRLTWWKQIIVGVGAAFMVPLFLNMISSELIGSIRGDGDKQTGDISKLFVLAGFCLVAAVSSRAFIRSLSEKVLQEVRSAKRNAQEAKEQAQVAQEAVAPFVEEELAEESPEEIKRREQEPAVTVSDDERSLLKAMTNSSFSMRSISGVAKDTGLDKSKVNAAISSLLAKQLVMQGQSSSGQPRWWPTAAGRAQVADR